MTARLLILSAALATVVSPAARADHDAIDKEFAKAAPDILAAIKARKAENVGVLKFRVQKGDGPLSDSVGELNMGLADRLEAALILAVNDEDNFGILGRPSLTVVKEKNAAANHADAEGRVAFFDGTYPLAWGNRSKKADWVKPSAFIAGTAKINKALTEVTVALEVFGKDGKLAELGKPFTVPVSRRTLVEAGYSYVLTPKEAPNQFDGARGPKAKKEGASQFKADDEEAGLKALVVRNEPARPGTDAAPAPVPPASAPLAISPVKLTILYGGVEVPVEGDKVREPKENEKVSFLLENTDTDPKALYAVVLKVNGKNTLFSEDAEAAHCLKWILGPGQKLEVKGFQVDNENYTEFKIKSDTESSAEVVRYGDLAGTLRMVVYRGQQVEDDPSILDKKAVQPDTLVLNAVARGAKSLKQGDDPPGSLKSLKADLQGRELKPDGARGMIVKGDKLEKGKIEKIYFQSLPTVGVADITLRYYAPK